MEKTIFNLISNNAASFIAIVVGLILLVTFIILNKVTGNFLFRVLNKIYTFIKGPTHHTLDDKTQDIINDINAELAVLRSEMDADRAYICEFHNGEVFASNNPRWRVSETYEKLKAGISYEGYNTQNVGVPLLWDGFLKIFYKIDAEIEGITKITKNLVCQSPCVFPRNLFFIDVEKMNINNGHIKATFEQQGTKFIIVTPIMNSDGMNIGYVGVDYCDEDFILTDDIIPCKLCKFASQIALLWNMNKDSKNNPHKEKFWIKP